VPILRKKLDFVRHFPNIRTAGIDAKVKDISALQSLHQLKYLTLIVTPAPLDILGSLASVETISISREWRPGSESIFSLPQVVQAGLGTLPYSNLERMGGWTDLKELCLRWGKVEELTGIPESVEIVELHVLRKLSSLRGLSACSQLRKLIVQECRGVCSLEGLQHCLRLKQIGMAITGPIEDLEPLRPLRELEYVFIAGRTIVGSVQNVDALYNQPNLRTLIIPRKSGLDPNQVLRIAPRCDVRLTKG
jgi:hypothetical protein